MSGGRAKDRRDGDCANASALCVTAVETSLRRRTVYLQMLGPWNFGSWFCPVRCLETGPGIIELWHFFFGFFFKKKKC